MSDTVATPPSLVLLDVAGNGMECERFLWIRGLSDRTLPPKARIDLVDELQRMPGELLHIASADGSLAATTATVRDDSGAGSCYLAVFSQRDPGEPVLGDVVQLASDRARAAGLAQVRCGDAETKPHMAALRERHGFVERERWRRFHVDTDTAPEMARLTEGALPDDVRVTTLAERTSLAEAAFAVYREGLHDATGDFPRPEESVEQWLKDFDSSPVLGRDMVLLLLGDGDEVLALVELERLAMRSSRAWVEFLTVAREHRGRGLARLAKRSVVQHARELGIQRLHTTNHADNEAICALNEQLGWTEDPVRVTLQLDLDD